MRTYVRSEDVNEPRGSLTVIGTIHLFASSPSVKGFSALANSQHTNLLQNMDSEFPDLAPSDFHLFLHLKKFLGGQSFDGDDEVKTAAREWFALQAGEFYIEGIERLVPRLDKCLNNGGDYVEK
ncbi:hypothetical protein ANN_06264 [Periplaneta americana]|uniref:Uncharacterized protein n=1 Tax=Periplaneta americana TaxID=6978 RepID=A0ABQ8TEW7_PERAM|nr:hypothetical protein ANN_06264 [Periplaneta americana]